MYRTSDEIAHVGQQLEAPEIDQKFYSDTGLVPAVWSGVTSVTPKSLPTTASRRKGRGPEMDACAGLIHAVFLHRPNI